MNITQEQFNQLEQIRQALRQIATRDDDTLIMANCRNAFYQVLVDIQQSNQKEEEEKVEPTADE